MSIDAGTRPDDETDVDTPALGRGTRIAVSLVVAAVSTLILWAAAPEAVNATFSGPGPFLRVCAVVAGFVVLSAVVRRVVSNPWLARAIVVVPAVAVTWWALSPYFGDDVVDEDFPVVTDTAPTATVEPAPSSTDVADVADAEPEPAPDTTPPETTPPAPAEPVALGVGAFQGLTGHHGSGTATVYELPDGSRVLRLEDFDVSNGPGLGIHLVPGADQRGTSGGVRLGDLKGNVGNQNYDIPPDLDLSGDWTVLIWCEPFSVEVANATATLG